MAVSYERGAPVRGLLANQDTPLPEGGPALDTVKAAAAREDPVALAGAAVGARRTAGESLGDRRSLGPCALAPRLELGGGWSRPSDGGSTRVGVPHRQALAALPTDSLLAPEGGGRASDRSGRGGEGSGSNGTRRNGEGGGPPPEGGGKASARGERGAPALVCVEPETLHSCTLDPKMYTLRFALIFFSPEPLFFHSSPQPPNPSPEDRCASRGCAVP